MTGILNLLLGAGGVIKDTYFNLVSLLLPGNGTNGAQNNTFLDSSTNNFTITRNGNTTQGTFSPFSQTGWGNYFNGSSSILETSTSIFGTWSTANASTTTATIEAMVYVNALQSAPANAYQNPSIINKGNTYLNFSVNSTGNIVFFHYDGSFRYITSSGTIQANTWNYVAVTITGGTATIYINGTSSGSGTWYGIQTVGLVAPTYIGQTPTGQYWNGYISNLRVSSTVRTIATPLVPYTNDGNTSLLTCQSNRFRDASTNGYTITATGSPSVVAFSPFAPTAAYTTAAVGGSGYFDGNGDYLQTPNNAAFNLSSVSFTIEAWVYRTNPTTSDYVFWSGTATGSNSGLNFYISGGNLLYIDNGVTGTTGYGSVTGNQWIHVALIRDGGDSYLYVNGVCANPSTPVTQAISTGGIGLIGCAGITTQGNFDGYISNFRIIKGQALVTGGANFTPPTGPVNATQVGWNGSTTALTGTCSILLNYTNAGITDATAKNDLETVGNAQISTSVSKFGGGSIAFDGTGDWLVIPSSNLFILGTGDFTIEAWGYPSVVGGGGLSRGLFQITSSAGFSTSATNSLAVATTNPSGNWGCIAANAFNNSSTAAVVNTWYHLALVRNSGTTKLYVNGTSVLSFADTTNYTCTFLTIGGYYDTNNIWNGYIDDFRVTKGYARYTANFTPPTAPFPVQ